MNYIKTLALLVIMSMIFMAAGYALGGQGGLLIAFIAAMGMNLYAFWGSDKAVLKRHNARLVGPHEAPELYGMVEQLAKNAELPMPKVYVINSDQPNAFATGRSPERAAVAATTGIMQLLSREELAGVMAHELAHIKNRDTLIMTVAATIAGAIAMLAQFGYFFRRASGDRQGGGAGYLGVILASMFAPMAAGLVKMMISRTREYSADRLGAEICGQPMWLASALEKISGGVRTRPMESVERSPASAHMFIINPLTGRRMDRLFSTHPDTGNRIAELEKLAFDMGQVGPARRG